MRESQNFTRECFVLRLDISGFFMGIDKSILFNQIILGISKKKWKEFFEPIKSIHFKTNENEILFN